MKITIDTETNTVTYEEESTVKQMSLYCKESFELISDIWTKVGWNEKYIYSFSWMGRPIIQLPEDMVRIQELIYQLKPDVIVETGVAHGGSLIYYASLCKAIEKGRIIGVDIEIRPHNRAAIEEHELSSYITLIEGDSVGEEVVKNVRDAIQPGEKVLVILDSCHTKEHVLKELHAYSPFVTPGSYIIATDGVMQSVYDTPRGEKNWKDDHPSNAALEFIEQESGYKLEQPEWPFNESELNRNVTHWPSAYIKKT